MFPSYRHNNTQHFTPTPERKKSNEIYEIAKFQLIRLRATRNGENKRQKRRKICITNLSIIWYTEHFGVRKTDVIFFVRQQNLYWMNLSNQLDYRTQNNVLSTMGKWNINKKKKNEEKHKFLIYFDFVRRTHQKRTMLVAVPLIVSTRKITLKIAKTQNVLRTILFNFFLRFRYTIWIPCRRCRWWRRRCEYTNTNTRKPPANPIRLSKSDNVR